MPDTYSLLPSKKPQVLINGKWVFYKERQFLRENNKPCNPGWKEIARGRLPIKMYGVIQSPSVGLQKPYVYFA